MGYGIPHEYLPIKDDGKIKTKAHAEYIEMRKKLYSLGSNSGVYCTDLPLPSDVLLGKGKPIQKHPGNVRLHAVVSSLLPKYDAAKRSERTKITNKVVEMVKALPSRFLSKDSGVWIEVHDAKARDKVSGLFRTQRRSSKSRPPDETFESAFASSIFDASPPKEGLKDLLFQNQLRQSPE